ncbi:hypothetical protein [Alteribacter natronophilus]|uniref:hypothetical protein n=1 Tax=Alteribacter natronophilus TaxID=2583810 RepID=UPI00110DD928|nr:hypothetical protein [Alteribacter natronophilus]TMW71607.1 hypothetical protein FGB90_11275 [Alteribacter natronophilus]
MGELEHLKAAYGFTKGDWIVPGEKLNTERGIKVVRRWANTQLMNWHIQWRESVDNRGLCLINRMIRTADGDMALLDTKGWLTLHDEVTSLFSYENRERDAAALVAGAAAVGMKMKGTDAKRPVMTEKCLLDAVKKLPSDTDPVVMSIIKKTLTEAVARLGKAETLPAMAEEDLPVMDPFTGLAQGREVYGQLFWTFSGREPEKGFRSMAGFLKEYSGAAGKKGLIVFLDEIDSFEVLSEEHYLEILREALVPWEFIRTADKIEKAGAKNPEKAYLLLEEMYKEWEQSRSFVLAFSEWVDGKREKVAN